MATTVVPNRNDSKQPSQTSITASQVRRYLGDIIWVARIMVSGILLVWARTWPAFRHELSFLVLLAILILPVRSVRWGTIYNFFVAGFFFALVIIGAQYFIEIVLLGGHHKELGGVLVAPLTEEPGKIFLLAILVLFNIRGFRNCYGACDLMLCGAALGGGFGFVENGSHLNQSFPIPNTPTFLGINIFPDSYGGFIGHGASTAFIALMLGVFLYAMRWRRWVMPGLLGVLGALLWMMVDHGLSNYAVAENSHGWIFPIRWIWAVDQNGRLSPYIFLFLILGVMAAERLLLWRILRRLPGLSTENCSTYLKRPFKEGWGYPQLRSLVMRAQGLFLYVLDYRHLAYLEAHSQGDIAVDKATLARWRDRYAGKVAVAQAVVKDL